MILRAFAAIHTIFSANIKTERKLRKPLIVIRAENSAEEITFHPSKDELGNQLEKFTKNVLDTAKQFGRWFKGYCICHAEESNNETGEKYIPFTFHDDINEF
jgi:hypothetical protein